MKLLGRVPWEGQGTWEDDRHTGGRVGGGVERERIPFRGKAGRRGHHGRCSARQGETHKTSWLPELNRAKATRHGWMVEGSSSRQVTSSTTYLTICPSIHIPIRNACGLLRSIILSDLDFSYHTAGSATTTARRNLRTNFPTLMMTV